MASIEKRISKNGKITYRVKLRLCGINQSATFDDLNDAEEWIRHCEREIKVKENYKKVRIKSKKLLPDSYKLVLCLPQSLFNKIKQVASRGHRSDFIIGLLEEYFNNNNTNDNIKVKRFLRIKDIPKYYPAFTQASIRFLIHEHKENNFTNCFHRIGLGNKKIVIDLDEFEKWISSGK